MGGGRFLMDSDSFTSTLRTYPKPMTAPSFQAGGPEPDAGPQRIASAPQWLAIGGAWLAFWLIYTVLLVALPR
jgi:hypothetical protein